MIVLGIQTAEFPNEVGLIKLEGKQLKTDTLTHAFIQIKDRNNTVEQLALITQKLLEKLNLKVTDIDLVSVCIGPGSYTGLRGGLSFAKGLCQFTDIKLIGVGSFEVLVHKVKSKKLKAKSRFVYLMDAKNDRVYYQRQSDRNVDVSDVKKVLQNIKVSATFVGSGAIAYNTIIKKSVKDAQFVSGSDNQLDAIAVAMTGHKKFTGAIFPKDYLYSVKPQYILPPNITKPGRQIKSEKLKVKSK